MAEDILYQVEKIVGKRTRNNAEEYLIRWVDYTSDDDSWQKEEHCVNCYSLIVKFEMAQYESQSKKENPNIIEFRRDEKNRIKLLVEWDMTKTREFFYSSAIRKCGDLHILINFYEKNVHMADRDEELMHFHNTISRSEDINESAKPHKIIAVANCKGEKLYLLSFRNEEEASIVDDAFVKTKCPDLLIKFYEKHLLT